MELTFESNFFTLLEMVDPNSRLEIDAALTRRTVLAHEVIYTQGEPATKVYIVASGVVEALTQSPDGQQTRSLGFIGRGDFFGDLAVLTGHTRLATVRACEETQLVQMEKLQFLKLLEKIPKMGAFFTRNLARRLHKTSTEAHLNVFSIDLTGNLRHFDLLTIFQAISSMGRTGELLIFNSNYEILGSFFFRDGQVGSARFVHLEGIEAIWQGFIQSATDGTFVFRIVPEPAAPITDANRISLECTDLLMQGVTRRDLYNSLPEPICLMEGRLRRVVETLAWDDADTADVAGRIWDLLAKRPQHLAAMWRRMNFSAVTFCTAVARMIDSGQAERLPDAPFDQTQKLP